MEKFAFHIPTLCSVNTLMKITMTSPDWPHGSIDELTPKLSIINESKQAHPDCDQVLNVFSAAGEAVIALAGSLAGCNDITNLLTTTEQLDSFLSRLSHLSIYGRLSCCWFSVLFSILSCFEPGPRTKRLVMFSTGVKKHTWSKGYHLWSIKPIQTATQQKCYVSNVRTRLEQYGLK